MSVGVLWLAMAGAHDDLEDPDIRRIQQDAMGVRSGCRTVKLSGPRPRVAVETHVVKVRCRFVTAGAQSRSVWPRSPGLRLVPRVCI